MSFMINTDVPVFLKCKLRVYLKNVLFCKKLFCVISYRDIVPETYGTPIWTFYYEKEKIKSDTHVLKIFSSCFLFQGL